MVKTPRKQNLSKRVSSIHINTSCKALHVSLFSRSTLLLAAVISKEETETSATAIFLKEVQDGVAKASKKANQPTAAKGVL
jgi:hypothetical protein